MTTLNYTKSDELLLSACKHYIRITDIDEESFVKEILNLSSQYCDNLSNDLVDQLTTNTPAIVAHS